MCRFVGQGLKISYEHCQGSSLRTFSTDVSMNRMEFLECLFPSEAVIGGSQRGIQYTEVSVSSLSLAYCAVLVGHTLHIYIQYALGCCNIPLAKIPMIFEYHLNKSHISYSNTSYIFPVCSSCTLLCSYGYSLSISIQQYFEFKSLTKIKA